jgi:type I restriction enzyme S subunit
MLSLLSFFFRGAVDLTKAITGAAQPQITRQSLSPIIFKYPSLSIQKKIVRKLDAIFVEIDKSAAAAEANANNAEALFQSYLSEIFEDVGKDWRELRIKDLGKVVTGNTPKTNEPENYGEYISFVKPGDFNSDGTIDFEKQKLSQIGMSKSRVIKENSALMVCIGATIGKCGFSEIEIVTNQQINSVTPTADFNHKFIYLQMLTNDFQKKVIDSSGQATLPIINKSKWESLLMKIPPLKIQLDIVERLDGLRFDTDNLKNSQLEKLQQLISLKNSILRNAFNGDLVKE